MSTTLYWNNLNNDGIYSTPSGWSYDQFGMSPYTDPSFPTDAFFRFDGQHSNATASCSANTFMPNCVGVYLGTGCTPSSIDVGYGFDIGTSSEGGLLYLGYANVTNYGTLILQGTPSPTEIHGSNSELSPAQWLGDITTYISSYAVQIHGHLKVLGITNTWTAVSYIGEPFIDVMSNSSLAIRANAFSGGSSSQYEANIGHFENSTLSASAGKVIWVCDSMMGASFDYPPYVFANTIKITSTYGTSASSIQLPNDYYTAMTPVELILDNGMSGGAQVYLELMDDIDTTYLKVEGFIDVVPYADIDFHPQTFEMQSTTYGNCAADFGSYVVDLQFRYLILGASIGSAGSISFDRGGRFLRCAAMYVHSNVTWTDGGSLQPIILEELAIPFEYSSETLVDVGDVEVNDSSGSTFKLSSPVAGHNFMCTDLTITAGIVQPVGKVEVSGNFVNSSYEPFGSPTYLSDFRVTGTAEIAVPTSVQNIDCRNGSMLRCQKAGAWLAKHERPVYNSDLPRFSAS